MALEVDFLPMATGPNALVDSQTAYAGSAYQTDGFPVGITMPGSFNKSLRQGTVMASVIANFIANTLNQSVLDNGDVVTLLAQFTAALNQLAETIGKPQVVEVPYSASGMVFDGNDGGLDVCVFETTLTGDVSSATLQNIADGVTVVFIVGQGGLGGHQFPASAWTGQPIIGWGGPDTAANTLSTQRFVVADGTLYAAGPVIAASGFLG